MHTNHGPKEDPLTDLGYEPRDVNVGALGKWTIGFYAFVAFSIIVSWLFMAGIQCGPIKIDGLSSKYMGKPDQFKARKIPEPPNPLLQDNVVAKTEIMDLRREEEARLKGYSWANDDKSKVTMPVDEAIKIIASKGAPKTGNEVPAVSKGNTTDQRKDDVPGVTTEVQPAPSAPKSKPSFSSAKL
jgi:hypothetical protein